MSSTRFSPKNLPTQGPIMATSEHHYYEDLTGSLKNCLNVENSNFKNEKEIWEKYEIERTVREIVIGGWKRVALQFPDDMLGDAGAIIKNLEMALQQQDRFERMSRGGKLSDLEKLAFGNEKRKDLTFGHEKQKARVDEVLDVEDRVNLHSNKAPHHDPVLTQNIEAETGVFSSNPKDNLHYFSLDSPYLVSKTEESNINLKLLENKNIDNIPKPKFTELGDGGLEVDFNMSDIGTGNKERGEKVITIHEPTFMDLGDGGLETDITNHSISIPTKQLTTNNKNKERRVRFYVLADTSYGSCCVDEIAAEHVDAQVIIHYGRSCLSPTVRLPVIYIFTTPSLDLDEVILSFQKTFEGKKHCVILMADIMYHRYIEFILKRLEQLGYTNIITPEVVHDPASNLPNRRIGLEVDLKNYSLFHVSEPSSALLLTLNSRVQDFYIFPTSKASTSTSETIRAISSSLIRRRYAIVNSLNTCSVFGILINTLSVAHHLRALETIQALIRSAGKKYYTFVIGKINVAKMANFSEVEGWVIVGCWESSLIESKDFYRPIITPWELEWVLTDEKVRVWTGEWRGDFDRIGNIVHDLKDENGSNLANDSSYYGLIQEDREHHLQADISPDVSSGSFDEPESDPPEFDLRTGRYVTDSRPMQITGRNKKCTVFANSTSPKISQALSHKYNGTLARIGNEMSPGAHFLKNQRKWTGLGSDFHESDTTDTLLEIGRIGVARGYVVGDEYKEERERT